jgi:hypothetical protein
MAASTVSSVKTCFFRKTRRGEIPKQVNEVYLHRDIFFGYLHGKRLTVDTFHSVASNSALQQLVVLDTNHHMDFGGALTCSSNCYDSSNCAVGT